MFDEAKRKLTDALDTYKQISSNTAIYGFIVFNLFFETDYLQLFMSKTSSQFLYFFHQLNVFRKNDCMTISKLETI